MLNEYDVSSYTEEQLFSILNLNNPSDRELEAQILSMIRKYKNIGNSSGDKLATFFSDIYDHFFETEEDAFGVEEGFMTLPDSYNFGNLQTQDLGNLQATGATQPPPPGTTQSYNRLSGSGNNPDNGPIGKANVGNTVKTAEPGVQLTKPLDFAKDNLNPLLKQTFKRIISIDSQYRDNKDITPTTNFTFNLSEPLKDVVSLSLYSIQIPYTWYTVNSDFGGNFFYLKGNSPGIDNGNHDYQISIPSGNYIASDLVTAVDSSLKSLSASHPEVDFGATQAIYNNGIKSNASGTSKAQLQIDITKIFNEGNYYLDFGTNWSSPFSYTDSQNVFHTSRLSTVGGYLGFNKSTQSCSAIYSNFYPYLSTSDYASNISLNECVVSGNGSFQIVPYVGSSYKTATTSYSAITITIPNGKYSQTQLIAQLNSSLLSNPNLDPNYSYCSWIDISGQDSYGTPLYQNGASYVIINCKLNPATMPKVQNLKIAALFSPTANSIFVDVGTNLASYFKMTYQQNNSDLLGNIVCEFNTLYSDTSILQSTYFVVGTNQIQFICTAIGYVDLSNNYYIDVAASQAGGYTLIDYIDAVKTPIASYPNTSQNTIQNTAFDYLSDGYLSLQTSIRTTFTTSQYKIRATGKINELFDIPSGFVDLSSQFVFSNPNHKLTPTQYRAAFDTIIISPKNEYGNKNAGNFVISFNGSFASASSIESSFQKTIANFQDAYGRAPFSNSTVIYAPNTGFVLTMNVQLKLNQTDYKLVFYSDPFGTHDPMTYPNSDLINNSWNSNWSFDLSYNLGVATPHVALSGLYTTVKNNTVENANQITIDDTNDTFYLKPYSTIEGLQTRANVYQIPIVLTHNTYSIVQLLSEINTKLSQNTLSQGTSLSLASINGQSFIGIRFNINKVFSTKDYRVVFYDPYSFVKCYSGASHKGSQGVQNATWDSTLGWLLGFRNSIEYDLNEYIGTTDVLNSTNYFGYYLNTNSNNCVLMGDTCVSTNLYNYFLIMLDDYVQNHLNDGLVTITSQETILSHGPSKRICDPATGQQITVPADYGEPGANYTQAQLYAFNQRVQSDTAKTKSYSSGPFVRDIFGIVPVKTAGLNVGSSYVEFGGTLQNQQRLYFGPVNIHRMTIQLLNDRGNMVDLNNANWSFSLICEQLYKNGYS